MGTTPAYANMHKWLQRGLTVCLVALVIEGALTFPLLAIWYGWPTLSLQQICSEFEKIRFADESLACIYPYPLFASSEGRDQKTAQDAWGSDRKSVVSGKSVSVRVDLGGGRILKKKTYVKL